MTDLVVTEDKIIERILTMELVRVTERAAVASAKLRGRGDEKAADQAAVDAMRRELNKLPIDGTVVIGEGDVVEKFVRIGDHFITLFASSENPRFMLIVGEMSLRDPEIQALLAEINADDGSTDLFKGAYSRAKADALKAASFDRQVLGARGLGYERLDQLAVELLLGIR